jgi:hypothetical protein
MRRGVIFLSVLFVVSSLGSTLISPVFSQPENIKVLSYSWYVDSLGYFVAVGEVQNVGLATIDSVVLSGIVYTKDGVAQAYSYTVAYVKYLIPQQKAPFYMEFPTAGGDLSWLSLGVDRVDFVINQAEATTSYQYPYLVVKESSATVTAEGVYWASGTIQNTGSQAATNIRVIGTFYNVSGAVVAVGYTDPLTPNILSSSGTVLFKVGAFDMNQTEVPASLAISSYSLLVQVGDPVLSGTPPSSPSSTGPANSSSSTQPQGPDPTGLLAPELAYATVAIAVVIGTAGIMLLLRKRNSKAVQKGMLPSRRKRK